MNVLVAAAHQVRGSARNCAFVHTLSPVESRRVVGADAFSSARWTCSRRNTTNLGSRTSKTACSPSWIAEVVGTTAQYRVTARW